MQLPQPIILALAAIPVIRHSVLAAPITIVAGDIGAVQARRIGVSGIPGLALTGGGVADSSLEARRIGVAGVPGIPLTRGGVADSGLEARRIGVAGTPGLALTRGCVADSDLEARQADISIAGSPEAEAQLQALPAFHLANPSLAYGPDGSPLA